MAEKPSYCYESGCPMAAKARGFVLGVGDPSTAKIALNLEAPGRDEIDFTIAPHADRSFLTTEKECNAELARRRKAYPELAEKFIQYGVPVVGKSGAQLNQWVLPAVGLKREELFIDNTLRCLPPKGKVASYPTGEDRKHAEKCCRHWDRWEEFNPSVQLVTLHPAGIMREVTPLPLQLKDFEKARDFAALGHKVMVLIGGKAFKAFMGFSENVTRIRGHYQVLGSDWVQKYRDSFSFAAKQKKNPKPVPERPIETQPESCKSFKRYKGKNAPKCSCAPCWNKWEERK